MIDLPKNYNIQEREQKWQTFWQERQIYAWKNNATRENSFVIDTPPPTVSGLLHIGHVYSYAQADFIARFQRMLGKDVFYPIGFDDNGLPTERLVEKQRNIRAQNLPREEFIAICKEVVETEEEKFRNLFKSLAISFDWSLEYQTISSRSRTLSQMSFLDLWNKGEIYRSNEPVLWDPVDQTALAQADIEDVEKTSLMNYIKFQTEDGQDLTIATTRPEILAACLCVFYHPEDARFKSLKGKYAITALFKLKVPILPDESVQPDKGTGLVMCCSFGDQTDLDWWRKYKLPAKIIISKNGRLIAPTFDDNCQNPAEAEQFFNEIANLKIIEARAKILEILKEQNLIIKQDEIIQNVKCAERSKAPLEIIMSPQWFVRTIKHKEALLAKANELNWYPPTMKIRLINWIESLAWDWCISRQRYFGVPFPIWYSKRIGEEGKILVATKDQLPIDPTEGLPAGYTRNEVEADLNIMDTWATSSISPQLSTLAVSEDFAIDFDQHQKLFPMDLRPQAHEIIRTWSFYTILKSYLHQNTLPWKNIMISGWCLAKDKTKMSKSKNNSTDPVALIEKFGADAIRYWSATTKLGADTAYAENVMLDGKRLVNKLWNASKFVSQYFHILTEDDKDINSPNLHQQISYTIDRWLFSKLVELQNSVTQAMIFYEYAQSLAQIEHFFWAIFCDNYLEIVKVRVYNEQINSLAGQKSAVITLYHSFQMILKLLAPILPHITEEIYQAFYQPAASIHSNGIWPAINNLATEVGVANQCKKIIEILSLVKKAKADKNLSIKAPIDIIEIIGESGIAEDLLQDLKNVTATDSLKMTDKFTFDGQQLENKNIKINLSYKD